MKKKKKGNMNPEFKEYFIEKLERIDEKLEKINVEIAEIKTELKNHLRHHAFDYKKNMLIISIIAIIVSCFVTILAKLIG